MDEHTLVSSSLGGRLEEVAALHCWNCPLFTLSGMDFEKPKPDQVLEGTLLVEPACSCIVLVASSFLLS